MAIARCAVRRALRRHRARRRDVVRAARAGARRRGLRVRRRPRVGRPAGHRAPAVAPGAAARAARHAGALGLGPRRDAVLRAPLDVERGPPHADAAAGADAALARRRADDRARRRLHARRSRAIPRSASRAPPTSRPSQSADAPDDTTLVLRYATPQPSLPGVLCELPLVPRHLLGRTAPGALRQAAFERAPVGNGPFRFVGRDVGARWTFERNPGFPASMGGPPTHAAPRRRGRRRADDEVRRARQRGARRRGGRADHGRARSARSGAARALVSRHVLDGARLQRDAPAVRRRARAPRRRRRARPHADHPGGARGVRARRRSAPRRPTTRSPSSARTRARARRPHARTRCSTLPAGGATPTAGVRRGGRPLALELLTVGSGDNAVEQLVQADLAARGIRLEIRTRELGAFLTAARAPVKPFDLLLTGVPGDLALSHLAAMFATSSAGGALDYAGFHRPALDAAFARAAAAPTLDAAPRRVAATPNACSPTRPPSPGSTTPRGVQGIARSLGGVTMDLRGELRDGRTLAPRRAVTLLLSPSQLSERRAAVAGPLAALVRIAARGSRARAGCRRASRPAQGAPVAPRRPLRARRRAPVLRSVRPTAPPLPGLRRGRAGRRARALVAHVAPSLARRARRPRRGAAPVRPGAGAARLRARRPRRVVRRLPALPEPRQRARTEPPVLQHLPRVDLAAAALRRARRAGDGGRTRDARPRARDLAARVRERIVEP